MENIDLKYLKNLCIYSVIFGALCALFSLFHSIMPILTLFVMPFLGAVIPLGALIFYDKFYSEFNKTYIILGAISGFFIWFSFCVIFIPLVWVFTLVNKNYYDYGISYLNPFLAILFFIMIATVYVSTNAVSGLFLGFIYKFIKGEKNG